MNCPRCGKSVDNRWHYCPNCGLSFRKQSFSNIFNKVFAEVKREMGIADKIEKDMEKNFEAIDMTPMIKDAKSFRINMPQRSGTKGFSIRIQTGTGAQPKIDVKTFGGVKKEDIRPQVEEQMKRMGIKPKMTEKPVIDFSEVKSTEEPRTMINRTAGGIRVELDMPGVKSEKDIEIKELESSVEVRAIAGDKAYFKILTKPARLQINKKELKKNKLIIELA